MGTIRVLVANRPCLMRELVLATIADQPDIEIVGELQDESEIKSAVEQKQPDFLIVALEGFSQLPPGCVLILKDHPDLKIIAIAAERNRSMVFHWHFPGIHSDQIESSEQGVLNALRGRTEVAGGSP